VNSDEINRKIVSRVSALRKSLDISREDLSARLDFDQQKIGRIERSEAICPAWYIVAIADIAGVDPGIFLSDILINSDIDHHTAFLSIILESVPKGQRKHLEAIINLLLDMDTDRTDIT